jgi:cytochrome c oxidase subunit 2
MMTSPLFLFLGAVAAILVLSVGLGVALAMGAYFIDRQLRGQPGPPAGQPARVEAAPRHPAAAHREAGPFAPLFALILLILGVLAGLYLRLTPVVASNRAGPVDNLFNTMLGIAASIFLLVEGILLFSAFRFRRKKGDTSDGLPLHGSNRLEFAWTLVPALIVAWLGIYSFQILTQIRTAPADGMVVEVTSRQFQWLFHYPDTGITSPDLYLPLDQPVRLKIRSEDVIHSFWVPAFRVKQDAVPQRELETYFTPSVTGSYRVVCAELCGAGHGRMGLISQVVVQSQADFDAWVAEQRGIAGRPPDPVTLFTTKYGCNGCHQLTAAGATGLVGPSLDGIGTTAGTRVPGLSAEDYLRESILNPNAFLAPQCPAGACPANVMPQDFAQRMPGPDLDILVDFLLQQQ